MIIAGWESTTHFISVSQTFIAENKADELCRSSFSSSPSFKGTVVRAFLTAMTQLFDSLISQSDDLQLSEQRLGVETELKTEGSTTPFTRTRTFDIAGL